MDEAGRVLTTATKMETRAGFADYLEKAEAGAVGRALGFLGYGTMAVLQESPDRPADTPQESRGDQRAQQAMRGSERGTYAATTGAAPKNDLEKASAAYHAAFTEKFGRRTDAMRYAIEAALLGKAETLKAGDKETWTDRHYRALRDRVEKAEPDAILPLAGRLYDAALGVPVEEAAA
jgi:hypothetical protein